jgi:hypothetical protein
MEDYLLVLGVYEGGEGHPIEQLDIMVLVDLMGCPRTRLDFKHCPTISVEDQKIGDALKI